MAKIREASNIYSWIIHIPMMERTRTSIIKKFDSTGGDKIVPNYQKDNYYYWKIVVAEVEKRITKEEAWMDKNLLWWESFKDVPENSYNKKFKIAQE